MLEPLALRVLSSQQGVNPALTQRLWQTNPEGLIRNLVKLYEQDPSSVTRVLEICQLVRINAPSPHPPPSSPPHTHHHFAHRHIH